MKHEDLIEPMAAALAESVRGEPVDAPEAGSLSDFTMELAARTIQILQLPPGEERERLMAEHKGTFKLIAEKHRINLAERANAQLSRGLEVSLAFAMRLVDSVV